MSPSAITTIATTPSLTSLESYFKNSKSSYLELNNGVNTPKQIIGDALKDRVESIDHEVCEPGDEDTFFVADLGEVYRQHMRWKLNLPRVKPFYGRIVLFNNHVKDANTAQRSSAILTPKSFAS
jgi:ornithine decarboxylase